ncbi:MAG: cobalt-precorrin-6A reductase [Pseudanabaenaceae cyanobacterium bins.68]|nr:cobalt-precorrin-6A reductase [Pseudanabaenaceae cyanobacterium bins.68]
MTNLPRVLILAGTGLARRLAEVLVDQVQVITSLAGRTSQPLDLAGEVRVGGFGGMEGLSNYLRTHQIQAVIDATHPFAQQISRHGAIACQELNIPHLFLVRLPWLPKIGDQWLEVASMTAAAQASSQFERVLLTIGRQQLEPFAAIANTWYLVRAIEAPNLILPHSQIWLERPPYSLAQELELLTRFAIAAIVSKNSGGMETYAKIQAARQLKLPVIMVQPPALPPGHQVQTIPEAIAWLEQTFGLDLTPETTRTGPSRIDCTAQ